MKQGDYIQQGDVLIQPVDTIPTNAVKTASRTLAEGEVTGHFHKISEGTNVTVSEVLTNEDKVLYIDALEEFTVDHPEHGQVTVPKGLHKVGKVMEWDHFAEEAKAVAD